MMESDSDLDSELYVESDDSDLYYPSYIDNDSMSDDASGNEQILGGMAEPFHSPFDSNFQDLIRLWGV